MKIEYKDIAKANEGLSNIDVKGKDYVMVNERVKAFRQLYPQGYIETDIIELTDDRCVMKTTAGYYMEDGKPTVLGTGMAFETKSSSYINKTSYIENCETSAVGRALGFLGIGIDTSIASAEEVSNAIKKQESFTRETKPTKKKETLIPEPPKQSEKEIKCSDCQSQILGVVKAGKTFTDTDIADETTKTYGRPLCWNCSVAASKVKKG